MKNRLILILLVFLSSCGEYNSDLAGGWQFMNGGMYWEMYIQPDTIYVFNSELLMIVDVSHQIKNNSLILNKYGHQVLNGEIEFLDNNGAIIHDSINGQPIKMSRIDDSNLALTDKATFQTFLSKFKQRHLEFPKNE
ncbi:hypothetical protein [Neolewinella agarilytica]|nr:hypothetical protein [Neolewinella agarilytica]